MAKRRAEDPLLHDSPAKRCYRPLCSVDMPLGSVCAAGGVSSSPPSLLAILGSRSRKRPHYFEEPENQEDAALHRKATLCDRRHAPHVLTVQTVSGSFQEHRCSSSSSRKRALENKPAGSDPVIPKDDAKADEDAEDSTYNSFQYWRTPLPELDLSLLEDAAVSHCPQTKDESKDKHSSSDAMET